jgi:hypothetical protein
MNMCLTVGGEEKDRCGVGIVHGGIPYGWAFPPGGGVYGGGQHP